jgi:hypothetical protein
MESQSQFIPRQGFGFKKAIGQVHGKPLSLDFGKGFTNSLVRQSAILNLAVFVY